MKISIIISTYNGAHKLPNVLQHVLDQANADMEVIVVVDGSTDSTAVTLAPFQLAGKVKVVWQENRGRAAVKNRGAAEASGSILIFYDDDMRPFPDSIWKHLLFHQQFDGLLCGNPIEEEYPNMPDIQRYKAHLTRLWTRKYQNDLNKLEVKNLFFTAANASVSKKNFVLLEGFDERLTDAEDYDFAHRALGKNISVYFDKSNLAYHDEKISCFSYIRRLREYNKAQQILSTFSKSGKSDLASKKNILKHVIYNILANRKIVRLIDRDFFKTLLPEKVRFKLYGAVIHALSAEFPYKPLL
jgi:glycosyltransferase involved in cell wall biosynthesis